MKFILILLSLFAGLTAQADLYEKIRIEDAIRVRIEQSVHSYDPEGRVQVQFQYRNFQGLLPGMTNTNERDTFSPNKIEASDIVSVKVQVSAKFEKIPEDLLTTIYSQVPVSSGRIAFKYNYVKPLVVEKLVPIQAKDLNDIVDKTIAALAKLFMILVGASVIIIMINSYLQTRKKLGAMKEQMNLLTSAVSENGGGSNQPAFIPQAPAASDFGAGRGLSGGASAAGLALENFALPSLQEIFADAYWCFEDEYAHWMWQNIDNRQKKELMMAMPFMRTYSLHFINLPVIEKIYHNHPCYLEPLAINDLSQNDLAIAVRKNLPLFHHLSSLRQSNLPLTIEEKLKALGAPASAKFTWANDKQSTFRTFTPQMQWGNISDKDEALLFKNPKIVPQEIKENINSLVWLAQRDEDYIKQVLAKYDAKSLSSAWVGPVEVLSKLEAHLPDKKLKNLNDYRQKNLATKKSIIFQSLFREGLKNDAA